MKIVFPNDYISVIPTEVDPGVPPQPIGLSVIVSGARNRARQAIESNADCFFGVGLEAGIYELEGIVMDVQIAYIVDRNGRESIGASPSFPIPPEFGKKLISGEARELEVLVDNHYGTKDIGEKGGFIKLLTRGAVTREDLTKYAVIMALIPWINTELYSVKK